MSQSKNARSPTLRILWAVATPLVAAGLCAAFVVIDFGWGGIFPNAFAQSAFLKILFYQLIMTHLTITAMSLCFHRMHTHQGVRFHPVVDGLMQIWLWFTTSMSKRDWVSVHVYHHTHSDTDLDPHSPVQKGLARIFFFGVGDYARAKSHPEVLKIRKRIPENRLEAFISRHIWLGPILVAAGSLIAFGPLYGGIIGLTTFVISPLYAVGGVNALAHYIGYRNHQTTDNSRNIGFLFPLNWMICGELDHNNHHAYPKSCSFQHRWYEFDVGYFYIRMLKLFGLADPKFVYRHRPKNRAITPDFARSTSR